MAILPCAKCGVKFKGKASAAYVYVSSGAAFGRYRVGLCPYDGDQFVELMDEELNRVDPAVYAHYDVSRCVACVLPFGTDGSASVIVTAYPRGGDQVQWVGALHLACSLPAALLAYVEKGLQAA